jgi:hypothetical protein
MRNNAPNIGQMQIKHPDNLEWINEIYKKTLEKELISDSLMVIAKK